MKIFELAARGLDLVAAFLKMRIVRLCALVLAVLVLLLVLTVFAVQLSRGDKFAGKRFDRPENYTMTIPGTEISFEMVYLPGGEFGMGSPEDEPGREPDEGPVHRVKVSPFWICATEVTWEQYEQYAIIPDSTMLDAVTLASPKINPEWIKRFTKWVFQRTEMFVCELDAITRPSPYYGAYDHGMGRRQKPAIGMSRLGAETFCQWLSKKTGEKYRLPTEAEWEYAARAGSPAAYCFGDDPSGLERYAWYEDNSDWETHKVGTGKPNDFGLYDMHGNVWEFCADAYDPDYYSLLSGKQVAADPLRKNSDDLKPVLRGGSWDDPPEALRSASRLEKQDWWNDRDPQRPRGRWWLVDANMVGFRVVRSFGE
ncbi:MAG: formylglycine-generating enzyme family protein [Candidatus Glassbacteria bacterium]|nr:formylglycine-generating enzyme family protein [Candidatus Glassbacteria bacterium]